MTVDRNVGFYEGLVKKKDFTNRIVERIVWELAQTVN